MRTCGQSTTIIERAVRPSFFHRHRTVIVRCRHRQHRFRTHRRFYRREIQRDFRGYVVAFFHRYRHRFRCDTAVAVHRLQSQGIRTHLRGRAVFIQRNAVFPNVFQSQRVAERVRCRCRYGHGFTKRYGNAFFARKRNGRFFQRVVDAVHVESYELRTTHAKFKLIQNPVFTKRREIRFRAGNGHRRPFTNGCGFLFLPYPTTAQRIGFRDANLGINPRVTARIAKVHAEL